MTNTFRVLIADRNRHVREFLRRELIREGYQVQVAKDDREIWSTIDLNGFPDILILDLDIPFRGGIPVLEKLQTLEVTLPVVVYAFHGERLNHPAVKQTAAFVEKEGSTDCLRAVISQVLHRYYPQCFLLEEPYKE